MRMICYKGFTLIELVLVIMLIGILSAVVLPRVLNKNDIEQQVQADGLVGLLRLAQLRAMNDPQALNNDSDQHHCGKVALTESGFSIANDCQTAQLMSPASLKAATDQGLYLGTHDIKLSVNTPYSLPLLVQFGKSPSINTELDKELLTTDSWLGRPFMVSNTGDEVLLSESGPLVINAVGKSVKVEIEGYIHAQK